MTALSVHGALCACRGRVCPYLLSSSVGQYGEERGPGPKGDFGHCSLLRTTMLIQISSWCNCCVGPFAALSLAKVVVIFKGNASGVSLKLPGGIPYSVVQLNHSRMSDTSFHAKFFMPGPSGPSTIGELDLNHGYMQRNTYTLATLSFLDQCKTYFCAWHDVDILIHRDKQAMLFLPEGHTGISLTCSSKASWALHPPDDRRAFFKELHRCGCLAQGLNVLWDRLDNLADFQLSLTNDGQTMSNFSMLNVCKNVSLDR